MLARKITGSISDNGWQELPEINGARYLHDYIWRMIRTHSILLLFAAVVIGCGPSKQPADLIIHGGIIHTVSDKFPNAEAVAVRGDSIIYVGMLDEAMSLKGSDTRIVDLQGKTLTPGFIEGHGHIMGLGYNEMNLDLLTTKSFAEVVARVKEAAAVAKPGAWILGRGWHQEKWDSLPAQMIGGFPTHELLSEAAPENPVALAHASGHAVLVNRKAMQLAGISGTSSEKIQIPIGGEIIRDQLGNPTGIFNETAEQLIEKVIPEQSAETDLEAFLRAQEACLRHGITAFHSAGEGQRVIDMLNSLHQEGRLKVRMYLMLSGTDRALLDNHFARGPQINDWVTVRAVKLYGDGALGSRGAWLLEDYNDHPGNRGKANMVMDSVYSISRRALKSGFQVCTHAIGDRANREALDQYEKAFRENPAQAEGARFRIEHAQHIHPDDIPRFAKLGVIPAMQAIHLSSDRPWAIDRLGEKRIVDGAYVWQTLLKSGAVIVNGTDVPVEPINPIASYYASVTRRTLSGVPPEGFEPQQRMTREQALRSYTLDAAYGAFMEKTTGSIEPGKKADFTIFTKDLLSVPEDEMLSTEVFMTIVGGQVLFEKSGNPK